MGAPRAPALAKRVSNATNGLRAILYVNPFFHVRQRLNEAPGVVHRGGPRHRARDLPLSQGSMPNDLWCADFKGDFKLGNRRY
ncbi:hypothetical protein V1292_000321 [Bradyrhizobium sp. AZCC 1719]